MLFEVVAYLRPSIFEVEVRVTDTAIEYRRLFGRV